MKVTSTQDPNDLKAIGRSTLFTIPTCVTTADMTLCCIASKWNAQHSGLQDIQIKVKALKLCLKVGF
jgi:hypothetical protein